MAQHHEGVDDGYEQRKIRVGVRMTILYALVYGGFVVVSVFQPTWMGARAVLGWNLAVAYGVGLIVLAIIFALVYNYICREQPAGALGGVSERTGPSPGQGGT